MAKKLKGKFIVWVAWDSEKAQIIDNGGNVPKDDLDPYIFDTIEEVNAFTLGVYEGNGWDSPTWFVEKDGKNIAG